MERLLILVGLVTFVVSPAHGSEFFRGVGDLPGGNFISYPRGVSGDGEVVVGSSWSTTWEGFRYLVDVDEIEGLGLGPYDGSEALAASRDGAVIVGVSTRPVKWTEEDGWVLLGSNLGWARGVSHDGTIIVGQSDQEAFRWTVQEGLVGRGSERG